jgi:hypothetical protein
VIKAKGKRQKAKVKTSSFNQGNQKQEAKLGSDFQTFAFCLLPFDFICIRHGRETISKNYRNPALGFMDDRYGIVSGGQRRRDGL